MPRERETTSAFIAGALVIIACGAVYYFWHADRDRRGPSLPTAQPVELPAAAAPPAPVVRHPIDAAPANAAVEPSLEAPPSVLEPTAPADTRSFVEVFGASVSQAALDRFFSFDDLIAQLVVTVDNLPRAKLARRLVPMHPVPGAFAVTGAVDAKRMSAENVARYDAHAALLQSLDLAALAAAYVRHYASFQSAYAALGYGEAYFNDRLVEVIDHLLAAPDMPADARLVQPGVLHAFADAELEARSAGHKLMMRVGPAHAALIKTRLRELRALVSVVELL